MVKLKFQIILVTLSLLLFFSHGLFAATTSKDPIYWQTIAPGLDYTQAVLPGSAISFGKLHAFRIDLNHYQLNLAFARDHNQATSSVKALTQKENGILGINGGFFSPNAKPLGLRIQNNEQRFSLKPISWWGVFYIQNNKPYIVSQSQFKLNKAMTLAVQAGPRLLVNGHVPPLKNGQSQRSLVCITNDHKLVIAATEYSLISTTALAKLLRRSTKRGGLGCVNALNLDGGSSTQLYSDIDNFPLEISNHHNVSDAIVVVKK